MRSLRLAAIVLCGQCVPCLGAGAMAAAPAAAQAQTSQAADEEEALIRRGIQLRKARDDLSARAEFQKAYDLTHSPRAAAQLGLAEFALGRWDDAELHVGEALRAPGDPWIAKYRVELDRSLATIKNHVARVEVLGEPPGAEVYVNGRLAGKLPLANPVAVSEGQVDVELRARGYARGTRTLSLKGGQYQRLVMRIEPERAAATGSVGTGQSGPAGPPFGEGGGESVHGTEGGASVGEAPQTAPSTMRRVAKWGSLGLSGVALATGIVATIIKESNTNTFETTNGGRCRDNNGRAVDSVTGLAVLECQSSLDAALSAKPWQVAGFVAAGVFAATWLALALTEPSPGSASGAHRASKPSPAWACVLAPGSGVGASCTFRF